MPKARKKPAYLLHKPSGQARVRIHGRDHYLGPHGSPESLAEYDQLIAEWYRTGDVVRSAITVDALCLRFLDHAETYYRNSEGTTTTEPANIRVALRPLIKIFGTTPARDFSPLKLKAVRQEMIATGLCRTSINRQIQRIKLMFRWAVENEYARVADGVMQFVVVAIRRVFGDRGVTGDVEGLRGEKSALLQRLNFRGQIPMELSPFSFATRWSGSLPGVNGNTDVQLLQPVG